MWKSFVFILHFLLLFFLFFGFNLLGINTRFIATGILCLLLLILPPCRNRFLKLLKVKASRRILTSLFLYLLVVTIIPLAHETSDFNYVDSIFKLIIFYIDCLILDSLLFLYKKSKSIEMLNWIFIVQSLIIFIAFASPSFLMLVQKFQFENIKEVSAQYLDYGTFRGLALAGEQFHGLTVVYGLMSIFVMKMYVESKSVKFLFVILALFAANMFVGRTGFVGFALAIVYLILEEGKKTFWIIMKAFVICILVVCAIYSFLPESIKLLLDDSVFRFAFQLFYNYKESGQADTSSTNRVLEMWTEHFSFFTFLVGDGKFLNANGSYYRHVDIGYLRQLFYGGFVFVGYSLYVVWKFIMGYFKHINFKKRHFEIILFIYLLIVHSKGLDFMYAIEPMLMVFIFYIHKYVNKCKTFLR